MATETDTSISGWTTETLKQFVSTVANIDGVHFDQRLRIQAREIDRRFGEVKELFHQQIATSKEAVEKAEAANERRFASTNEFRAQMADQQRTLITRAESEAKLETAMANIRMNGSRLDKLEGASSGRRESAADHSSNITLLVSIVAVAATVAGLYLGRVGAQPSAGAQPPALVLPAPLR